MSSFVSLFKRMLFLSVAKLKGVDPRGVAMIAELGPPVSDARVHALDCIFAYRLLLGRNPDSTELQYIEHKSKNVTFREFLSELMASAEFGNTAGLFPSGYKLMSQLADFRFWFYTDDREMGVRMGLGIYEPESDKFFRKTLQPGMTCWDIGAQTGYFSCLFASLVGVDGRVVSYEPMPGSYAMLNENIVENGYEKLVQSKRLACSDRTGRLPMVVRSHMLVADEQAADSELIECVKLDDENNPPPNLVKIDVEGHEPAVLRGMKITLQKWSPIIVMELNEYWLRKNSGACGADVVQMLSDMDYEVRLLGALDIIDGKNFQRGLLDNNNVVATRKRR